jgi:multidrug efflux pump subunit AcrB
MSDSTSSNSSRNTHKGAIAYMARNPIAANLLMIILIAGGIWMTGHMQKEVFPDFQLDIVEVRVNYPGSSPAEVEKGILLPVEEAVRSVQGIKEVVSIAREGSGRVNIELVAGTNRMKAFQDIDQAVNRIRTFPDDIEQPLVRLQSRQRDVMEIGLYGGNDIWTLRKLAERLRDTLLNSRGITQVEISRAPDYMTHVEVPDYKLREYNLTLGEVAELIRKSSEDIPAGAIETKSGEILLRMKERKQWSNEFSEIVIVSSDTGASIKLGELAEITDGFEEIGFHGQFNREPYIGVEIFRVGNQSPLDIAERVKDIMEDFGPTLPPGIQFRIDSNRADDFRERLSLLIENGILAIVIVLGILTLFLDFRLAFWVMVGMVISFLGSLVLLPFVGISINMISMFGFLIVLGIVVDDAIVVGENVHEFRAGGMNILEASIKGARDISKPVIFSILTNIIAFVPLMFIPGQTGKFWKPLPVVVIVVLSVSLFEALLILPAHLGHVSRNSFSLVGKRIRDWQKRFSHRFSHFIQTRYKPFLELCLRNRYITLSVALAILIVVGGFGLSDHMGMIMMPEVSADEIEAGVRLPVNTTPEQAAKFAREITDSTHRMFREHDLWKVAEGIKTNVRGQNFIDVEIVMKPPDQRDMSAQEVIELWRDEIGDIEGVDQITFEAERGPGGARQDISVDLSHSNIDVLEQASRAFLQRVREFESTRDVSDNYNKGKPQYDFTLLVEGQSLGLSPSDVGKQLRDAFYGALSFRQLRGTNEIEIRVKLPLEQRRRMFNLEEMMIRNRDGIEVPLMEVVELKEGEAFTSINRRDGRRVVTVSMDVEPKGAMNRVIRSLNEEVLPRLRSDFPGITWTFEGNQAEMRESTSVLWGGFLLVLIIMYTLLAVAFSSYVQPLIVMTAIPFGIVGAVIGHILLGYDLSLISLMGVVALSGVVVNDSLIMIDYANKKRAEVSAFDAIQEAGIRRFRPIILTTLTTFGGLTPIILETSRQAYYLIPMAISLGFGIIFSTSIILVIVPSLYMILEDILSLHLIRSIRKQNKSS